MTKSHSGSRNILWIPAFILLVACVLGGAMVAVTSNTKASATGPKVATLNLTILMTKPGTDIGPAYSNTNITLPAHAKVTVTIVNQDPGDTALPSGSPFTNVTGTVGGTAFIDGIPYRSLDVSKVAHTFTVPKLGLNVPVPGDAPAGHSDITVTFTFMTGNAGTYTFQCMDPCGDGPSGWQGPMETKGYMIGQITVQ
jgi:hypothetical protein